MKKFIFLILFLSSFVSGFSQGKTKSKNFYNKDFKWTIAIPEDFENVSPKEWAKMQDRGKEAIENTMNEEVTNQATVLFAIKNGQFNYMESNYQPFDEEVDGNYQETMAALNAILYETFTNQMPDAKVDTSTTTTEISGLTFRTFNIRLEFPNGIVMNTIMFSRLFGKRDFTVNIVYVDELEGKKMKDAWFGSKFGK